uniref:Uncharacterized protein n=1 Tax=Oryza nivara TaxID=4536 RepID=A0A0E0FG62_ORYNI
MPANDHRWPSERMDCRTSETEDNAYCQEDQRIEAGIEMLRQACPRRRPPILEATTTGGREGYSLGLKFPPLIEIPRIHSFEY